MTQDERLLETLKKLAADLYASRQRVQQLESGDREPVAIIGMGCRLPGGVTGPDQLWDLVSGGADAITPFPADRGWDLDGCGDDYARQAGFVLDVADFDAAFFGISPREAVAMDPQQRLILEVSWEAIERAGIDPRSLRGSRTGVFVGASSSGYETNLLATDTGGEGFLLTGNAISVISGRVSYTLGLEGPAATLDTACSSSLVALHLAVRSLRSGESSMALAGGVAVLSTPGSFVEFARQGGMAADGRCKAFAAGADGIGWGEGAGMIVLERLSDARRNGHRVLAVIAGSAVNQDGASNGLSAPNGPSQQRVIRDALADARLGTADVDAVEAHGTGTSLGDPIEAQALLATYGQDRDVPLWLGSVKSNIGHTQTAAGVAGVIKMVQALRHGRLPRTLHADSPTPHVDWASGNVRLLQDDLAWPAVERPRRAAVSAFGISGTNVHLILEEAPAVEDPVEAAPVVEPLVSGGVCVWPISGRSAAGLAGQAGRLRERVVAEPGLDCAAIGWSLATTRSAFERRAVVVGAGQELTAGLASIATGQPAANVVSGVAGSGDRTVFVFPGQGSQWLGMGRELVGSCPVFAARLAECSTALAPWTDWSLEEVLSSESIDFQSAGLVQPVLWAVMVSLAAVWQAAGVEPAAVVGHSQGEIAAAVVAGVLSLEDGARVVALRSKALEALAGRGGMVSIAAPVATVQGLIGDTEVSIAAVNGPSSTVVSGSPDALQALIGSAEAAGIRTRTIAVDYASHSAQVENLEHEIVQVLQGIQPQPARVVMVSSRTGHPIEGPELDPGYWYASLRETVRFSDAIETLAGQGYQCFVECSPHPVLTGAITDTITQHSNAETPVVVGTLRRDDGGPTRLLTSLAEAWTHGLPISWQTILRITNTIDLPTYAFQHKRYWPQPKPVESARAYDQAESDFWAAVEQGELAELAETLSVEDELLGAVLPSLRSWRRRERAGAAVTDWRYRVTWTALPNLTSAPALTGSWLVVGDDADGARALTEQVLIEHGAEVISLAATDRRALDEALATLDVQLSGVVSTLALDETPLPDHPLVPSGTAANLWLLQALGEAGIDAPLWVLTRGAVTTSPATAVTTAPTTAGASPAQAQSWGLGRVASLEYPYRWGGLIDLPANWDERTGARLAGVLADGTEDQVAIRGAGVLARRLVRAAAYRPDTERWTPRGTVLLTGGTGSTGRYVSPWLAGRGASRIVLAGRTGAEAAGLADLAAEVAGAGSRVDVLACDVAERDQVAGLLDTIAATGPALSSVLHSANTVYVTPLAHTDTAGLASSLGAKAGGAGHLDELTAELDLDAFVLFSSIAATWGSNDHGAYAASNAHLDALAEDRRRRGLPGTSVGWGVWDTRDWAAVDAAADQRAGTVTPTKLLRQGVKFLDPDLALTALGQALDEDEAYLAVADVDWQRFGPVYTAARQRPLLQFIAEAHEAESVTTPAAETALATELAGADPAQRLRSVLELVRGHAAAVLGHAAADDVPAGRAFRELGFDSLTAVELRNRLAAATGLTLPSTVVFDYPNPNGLAREIVARVFGSDAPVALATREVSDDPIAIVGMGCRYAGGVTDPDALWDLVSRGQDAISGFPLDRGWNTEGLFDDDPDSIGTSYVAEGGFLRGVADFDPDFFGINRREALAMDPQQRILLELTWETLENAGIDPDSLRSSATGVYVGASSSGYGSLMAGDEATEGYLIVANTASVLSGRISYSLGLEGPAVTIDTACSSSLVALHLAVQALRSGQCDLALAGGVMVMVDPTEFVGFSRQRVLAADGRCKAFADGADGMGMAEGAGLLLVERLSDARRNGHQVLAVVRGSAVNQDGASNGLTAPNGPSQQRVIRAALADAGLTTADVDAVEAHGTGTELGDPIEAQALLATYGQDREAPLWLGSVKSNLGHSQQAAGVAGVIKMVQALRHGRLPATLHAEVPSSLVDWTSGAVRLLQEPADWPAGERPRRTGISAFGISGTNAHVILEEAGPATVEPGVPPTCLAGAQALQISARTAAGLPAQAARLRDHLRAHPELDPADVAFSLATGRATLEHRAVILGDPIEGLDALADRRSAAGVVTGVARTIGRVGFLFAGQGSQRAGMAAELYAASPAFAVAFDSACTLIEPHLGLAEADPTLREVLLADAGELADQTLYAQTGLFAVEVGLVALLAEAGLAPDAVAGHSVGEIAAAYVAGVLSLADAARLVAQRARLMQALPAGGAMAAIGIAEDQLELPDGVTLAAVNGPTSVVVSGDAGAVERLTAEHRDRGDRVRTLRVSHAFHSHRIDPVLDELAGVASELAHATPRLLWAGALDGALIGEPDAGYWAAQARGAVRFAAAVETLAEQGVTVFIEIGPDGTLSAMGSAVLAEATFVPTQRPEVPATDAVLGALAQAHVIGLPVRWGELVRGNRVPLPTYAFDHHRFWPATIGGRGGDDSVLQWRYRVDREPIPLPSTGELTGNWLLVGSNDAVEHALKEGGATVLTCSLDELDSLAADLLAGLRGVVSVLALDDTPVDGSPVLTRGLVDTLALVQAGIDAPLWVLTGPETDPRHAPVWGLGRVVALEHPQRWGGLVQTGPEPDAALLCAVLAGSEDQVRIDQDGLFARRLVRAESPRPTAPWRPSGTVLVTGGTGGVGGHVCRWLAERHTPELVLTSRRGPAAAGVAEQAAELAAAGADVSVLACDVAVRDQVAAVLAGLPRLCGIVHAAGVGQAIPVSELDLAGLADSLAAKAAGAVWLDELTDGLERFVLFSSVSATWGSAMQPGYAAANAFLDALAEQRSARGEPATSVAWGVWRGAGMGAGEAAEQLRRFGLVPMDAARGIRALAATVDAGETQVTVADVDWPVFAQTFTLRRPSPLLSTLADATRVLTEPAAPVDSDFAAQLSTLSSADRQRRLVELVRTEAAVVLGHSGTDAIGADRPFTELGLDSLTSVELRNRLAAITGLTLPGTLVFDHPTPDVLAQFLRGRLGDDDSGGPGAVLAGLDRLEAGLSALADPATREDVRRRLRGILAGLDATPEDGDGIEFGSASPDEVFDFLDKEFGSP